MKNEELDESVFYLRSQKVFFFNAYFSIFPDKMVDIDQGWLKDKKND